MECIIERELYMPFTCAHPAAVAPLATKRRPWLDATGLIIGSMAPDFEYFIHFKAQAIVGHTPMGCLYLNLPLAFAAAYLWHRIVKRPLVRSLPSCAGPCVAPLYRGQWRMQSVKDMLVFASSALIGMFTHIAWDAWTHPDGFFVAIIPALSHTFSVLGIRVAVYQALQQGSTLLGLWIVAAVLHGMAGKANAMIPSADKRLKRRYWGLVVLVVAVVMAIHAAFVPPQSGMAYFGVFVVSLISAAAIGVLAASMLYRICGVYEDIDGKRTEGKESGRNL